MIFETITLAIKAERLLKSRGFQCKVVKADSVGACRYGVALSCNYMRKAIDIVASGGIPILQTGDYGRGGVAQ